MTMRHDPPNCILTPDKTGRLMSALTIHTDHSLARFCSRVLLACASVWIFCCFSPQAIAGVSRIDQVLALPENKVDIGVAALIFAKEIYPDMDVEAYSRQLDELVDRARQYVGNRQDPKERIRALSEFFFTIEGYTYDLSPGSSKKTENQFLNGILDTKRGKCSTMPMLYLVVAQRLGYPIYPVAAPDHLFLRYKDRQHKYINIEATSAAAGSPADETYIMGLDIGETALKKGSYLRTMTYRQYLGDLLCTNAVYFGLNGDIDRSIEYLEKAIQLNPKYPDYYELLKIVYLKKSKRVSNTELVAEYREKAQLNFLKTEELGFVRPR